MDAQTEQSWNYDPEYHRIADYVGIDVHDRNDTELIKKIAYVKGWAEEQTKSDNVEDALRAMEGVRKQLGTTSRGKLLANELYQYLRIGGKKPSPSRGIAKKRSSAGGIKGIIQKTVETMVKEALR